MFYNKLNFSYLFYVTGSFYPLRLKRWKSLKTMVYDGTLLFIRMFWHAAVWLPFTLYKFWVKMKIKVDKSDNCSCITKSNAFVQRCFQVYRHYKVLQNEWSLKFSTHKNRLPIQWCHAIFWFSMKSMQSHYNRVVAVTTERHRNLHFHCDDLCYPPTLCVSYTTHSTAKKIRRLIIIIITFWITFCALFPNQNMAFRLGIESLFFVGTKLEGGWFYCEERSGRPFSTYVHQLNTLMKSGISICSLHKAQLTNMELYFNRLTLTVLYI